jgi:filamentous hemagglutinin family protein
VFLAMALLAGASAHGQIVRDGTMGPPGPLSGPNYMIPHTDGTLRSNNLFHSFSQFGLSSGESATFSGPDSIRNVLSRVTGGSPSTINGLLQTSGMPLADFYFINPAGVVFGQNAQINVPAAFVVTTANAIVLGEGGRFGASLDPADAVLTSALPVAFGFLGENPASIQVQGGMLQAADRQSLALVGGDIEVTGSLRAASGRVSLASVGGPGTVGYNATNQTPQLDVSTYGSLGHVDLIDEGQGGYISVAGNPGGTVLIRSGQLLLEGYHMTAQTTGATDHPGTGMDIEVGGDMVLQTTPAGGMAEIACSSAASATGRAGDTHIAAQTLQVAGDLTKNWAADIGSRAFGAGGAGNVDITVDSLTMGDLSFISTPALSTGNGGNITIHAGSVEISGVNGYSYISSLSQGGGAAGTIEISADSFLARGGRGGYVGVTTQTNQLGTGAPGQLILTAGDVQLLDGAQLSASLFNALGTGGDVEVNADTLLISGLNPHYYPAGIFATVGDPGWGVPTPDSRGGSIRLNTGALEVTAGGQIGAYTTGRARAGDIEFEGGTVNLHDQAFVYAGSWGPGDGGDIRVTCDGLSLSNAAYLSVTAFSTNPASDGGTLDVNAHSITIAGPATSADPFGQDFTGLSTAARGGSGGSVHITADTMSLSNRAAVSSSAYGVGPAGDLTVDVGSLDILSGSNLIASTQGLGNGGTVNVTADDVLVSGVHPDPYMVLGQPHMAPSAIASEAVGGGGDAGQIIISADRLRVLNGGVVTATTGGPGHAGTIEVKANEVTVSGFDPASEQFLIDHGYDPKLARASIASAALDPTGSNPDSATGDAGAIQVQAAKLLVTEKGRISSETQTAGNGGSIALDVGELRVTDAGEIASSSTGIGNAGTIVAEADRDIIMQRQAAITTSADLANAGDFTLRAGRNINLTDSLISARAALDGGNIKLTAADTVYLFNSEITTSAGGSGGNITIDPHVTVLNHSRCAADASLGNGGNILIVTDSFLASDSVMSASSEYGIAGTIQVTSPFADLAGILIPLSGSLLSPGIQLADPCVTRFLRGASSFVVTGREGVPIEPGAWLPSLDVQLASGNKDRPEETPR